MSDGFPFLDILFFAMVAAFIALRLRSVLGRRTGHERRRPDPLTAPGARADEKVVAMPERAAPAGAEGGVAAEAHDPTLKSGLAAIRLADKAFNPGDFLNGAVNAFGMIVDAFARGDKDALRPLLAPDVFQGFAKAIDDRSRHGQTLATELVAMPKAELVGAMMSGTRARLTVRFESEQINVTRDTKGEIVEGDPTRTEQVVDIWTFERDTRSRDPNWQLVETRTPA
jgi:predicted lipid-binding transport protein (Tim44 family)